MKGYPIKVTPRRELHSKSDTSVATSTSSPLSLFNNTNKSPKTMLTTTHSQASSTDLSDVKKSLHVSNLEEIEEDPKSKKKPINGVEEVDVENEEKKSQKDNRSEDTEDEDVETTSDTDSSNDDENNVNVNKEESPNKKAESPKKPVLIESKTISYQETLKLVDNMRLPIREFDEVDSAKKTKISPNNCIGKIIQLSNSYSIAICLVVVAVIISYKCLGGSGTDRSRFASSASSSTSPPHSFSSNEKQAELPSRKETTMLFRTAISELKNSYNQSEFFWAQIESSFQHSVINGNVPSVVMLVSDEATRHLADQLVYDILKKLHYNVLKRTTRLEKLVIDPVDDQTLSHLISTKDTDKSKLHVDRQLEGLFGSNEKLALVKNIERMPAHAMMLFYSYGDYENARYDGVLIFMRLNLELTLEDEQRQRFDSSLAALTEFAENYMFKIWSKFIAADQLRPLFTRIANNLCFVRNNN